MLEFIKYAKTFSPKLKSVTVQFSNIIISDIMEYLVELRKPVERLQIRMHQIQTNLSEIKRITSMWLKQPLFVRKDGKKDSVLCLTERENRVIKRYTEIETASQTVHR